MNIPDERIEIYSDPSGDAYGQVKQSGRGEQAQSLTLKELVISTGELFV